MTIKQLIEVLERMDPDREVYKTYGEFDLLKKVQGVGSVVGPKDETVAVIR